MRNRVRAALAGGTVALGAVVLASDIIGQWPTLIVLVCSLACFAYPLAVHCPSCLRPMMIRKARVLGVKVTARGLHGIPRACHWCGTSFE